MPDKDATGACGCLLCAVLIMLCMWGAQCEPQKMDRSQVFGDWAYDNDRSVIDEVPEFFECRLALKTNGVCKGMLPSIIAGPWDAAQSYSKLTTIDGRWKVVLDHNRRERIDIINNRHGFEFAVKTPAELYTYI